MPTEGLQKLSIPVHDAPYGSARARQPLVDYSVPDPVDAPVRVFFRNIEAALIREIRRADVIAGCVAWLTSVPVLEALSQVPGGVALIVQKEDFLRPDLSAGRGTPWAQRLRSLYDRLPEPPMRFAWPFPVCALNRADGEPADPIRCLGNHNSDRKPAFPRMHNKFLVFCERVPGASSWFEDVRALSVWTGSFNPSKNATESLENAVLIDSPEVAGAYLREWAQLYAVSEPLDWETPWASPDYFRIGS